MEVLAMLSLEAVPVVQTPNRTSLTEVEKSRLNELLAASSRTFALTIPLLPVEIRGSIQISYLLLRAADGIEDAVHGDLSDRISLLNQFRRVLLGAEKTSGLVAKCRFFARQLPQGGEQSVLLNLDLLFAGLDAESPAVARQIRRHCERILCRMSYWLAFGTKEGELTLRDFGELSDYMYSVAGIVGELLTELFVLHNAKSPRLSLMVRAADFGAGLQLTNIIRDSAEDAEEGRRFLPASWAFVGLEQGPVRLEALIQLARIRLRTATEYTCHLPLEEPGVRLFCFVPIVLALATLEAMLVRVEDSVAGELVKIERSALPGLLLRAKEAIGGNDTVSALHDQLDARIELASRRHRR
jgi:farnesyl-diphosphate farnesyltransferase